MRPLFILLVAASSLLQSSAQDPSTPPKLSALDRAAAQRNARHDNTRYDAFFKKYTKRYFGVGFDWQYFKAQGMAESELSATARSMVGARGVMQLMPSTFQEIQTKRPEFESIDDPEWNIAAGIQRAAIYGNCGSPSARIPIARASCSAVTTPARARSGAPPRQHMRSSSTKCAGRTSRSSRRKFRAGATARRSAT